MEKIKIENDVPVPEKIQFPLEDLKVNESFEFDQKYINVITSTAYRIKGKTNKVYTVRRTSPTRGRVWRTE